MADRRVARLSSVARVSAAFMGSSRQSLDEPWHVIMRGLKDQAVVRVPIEAAAKTLPELIEAVRNGQDVIILDGDKPVARLENASRSGFRFGVMVDVLQGSIPNFLEPMEQDELALWEGQGDETC